MIELPHLILASASPRRAEILTSVGWPFTKIAADVDESRLGAESPDEYVLRLAKAKAEDVAQNYPNEMVLGADTIVVIDSEIIGKPKDEADARRMLEKISGNWHDVLTGVAIAFNGKTQTALQRTKVKFAELNDDEINFLVEKGEPLDKAGAYAVQAQASLFIEKIDGDYWNVVGLPVNLVYKLMRM